MHTDAYEDLLCPLNFFFTSLIAAATTQRIALGHSHLAHTSFACHVSNITSNVASIHLVFRELEDGNTETAIHS